MKRILVTLAALAALAGCQPGVELVDCTEANQNKISARIEAGLHRCAIDYSKPLYLSGPGGDAVSALKIAAKVREAGTETIVVGRCESGCAVISASGGHRVAYWPVGWHAATSESMTANLVQFLAGDTRIARAVSANLSADMAYYRPEEALYYGLIDEARSCLPVWPSGADRPLCY